MKCEILSIRNEKMMKCLTKELDKSMMTATKALTKMRRKYAAYKSAIMQELLENKEVNICKILKEVKEHCGAGFNLVAFNEAHAYVKTHC